MANAYIDGNDKGTLIAVSSVNSKAVVQLVANPANGRLLVDTGGGAGITSINTDTTAAQLLVVGTAGTDFAIVDNGTGTHTFNLPTASASNRGALSTTDWTTFNNKGSGTVTAVSVATANGLAGSSSGGATPALTLSTTITGILLGNGTAISAASAGTNYVAPGSITTSGLTMNTAKMLGRATAASGAIEEIAVTGSGSAVLATTPTLVTPVLGAATATSINGLTLTSSTGVITITNGKTLAVTNSLTLSGTDSTTMTFPTTTATIARTDAGQTFTGVNVFTSPKIVTAINDTNGNGLFNLTATASAVNQVTLANAATGNNPSFTAAGETNVGLVLSGKGTRGVIMNNAMTEKVVAISDGAGAVIDASLGNLFTWSASADRTAGTTTNFTAGQKLVIEFTASGGARTLTLPTATTGDFAYGSDITVLTQTVSGKTDMIGCIYNGAASRWYVVAYTKGF